MFKVSAASRLHAAKRAITPAFVEALLKGFGVDLPKLLEQAAAKGFNGKPKVSKAKGDIGYFQVPNSVAKIISEKLTKKLGKPANPRFPEWEHEGLRIQVYVESEGKDSKFNNSNSSFQVRDIASFTGYSDNLRESRQPKSPR